MLVHSYVAHAESSTGKFDSSLDRSLTSGEKFAYSATCISEFLIDIQVKTCRWLINKKKKKKKLNGIVTLSRITLHSVK